MVGGEGEFRFDSEGEPEGLPHPGRRAPKFPNPTREVGKNKNAF